MSSDKSKILRRMLNIEEQMQYFQRNLGQVKN